MRGLPARLAVGSRLLLFGILTSFGYLLYGIFLTGVSATVLTLNTFVWLFLLQCVRVERRALRFRSPLRTIKSVLSAHLVGFALCQFAYWYLFWSGASMLKGAGETNFATLALAILALNTLATPIAMHFAKRDQIAKPPVWPFIALALPLSLSIILLELDMTWRELGSKLQFLDDWHSISIELSSPAVLVSLCLLAAVIAEAIGDFLLTRLDIIKSVTKKHFAHHLEVATFIDHEVDSFARQTSVDTLVEIVFSACDAKLKVTSTEHDAILSRLHQLRNADLPVENRDELERRLSAAQATSDRLFDEALSRLDKAEACRNELKGASDERRRAIRRFLIRDYFQEIYSHVEGNLDEASLQRMREDARESAVDLMAIAGVLLSSLLMIVEVARTNASPTWPSMWLFFVLCLLGLTGSSARPICLLPLLKRHAEALIPPIYAVRPLIYFGLGWLLLHFFNLGSWIKANVPLPAKLDILPHGFFTYQLGAMVALLAAGCAWWIAYHRAKHAVPVSG